MHKKALGAHEPYIIVIIAVILFKIYEWLYGPVKNEFEAHKTRIKKKVKNNELGTC